MKVPSAVGVPEIVITSAAQVAETPAGNPFTPVASLSSEIPVAPVVAIVMLVKAVLTQSVGEEEATPAVLSALTVIVPSAVSVVHPPPVRGIE